MEQLRLGIIGAGSVVEKKHLPALAEIPELAVTALSRRTEAALHQTADRFRIGKRFTDFRHLLDDPDVDAVLIATGPDTQPEIIRAATSARKPMFVEKPLAGTAAEALQLRGLLEAAGVYCQVGFNKRFYYGYRQAKELIAAGELGVPCGFSGRFWFQPGRRDGLLHNGIHFLDLAAFLVGPLQEVTARRATLPADTRGVTTLSITAGAASGAVVSLLLSSSASWDYIGEHVDIVGSNQHALSITNGRELRVFRQNEAQASRLYENSLSVHWWSGHDEQGFIPQLRVFAHRVLHGTDSPVPRQPLLDMAADVDAGVRSLVVLEAVKRSIAEQSSIVLPGTLWAP
jgi:predicted dehydrogenase